MAAFLLNSKETEFNALLKETENKEDKTCGLFKIVKSIYLKINGSEDWESLFYEGINEAKKQNYIENIEFGQPLKSIFC